ncbi:MAG: hypothetical protein WCY05_06805 [Candidatus Omnitrophota bacterium]
MGFYSNVAAEAIKRVKVGYNPTVRPACADFVSNILLAAGWEGNRITYVPNFFSYGTKVVSPQAGDLIIFWGTYDAVAPAGIGKEDDKTHVGIMISASEFVHYSSSADAPVRDFLDGYWLTHKECFLRMCAPAGEVLSPFDSGMAKLKSLGILSGNHKSGDVVRWEELVNVVLRTKKVVESSASATKKSIQINPEAVKESKKIAKKGGSGMLSGIMRLVYLTVAIIIGAEEPGNGEAKKAAVIAEVKALITEAGIKLPNFLDGFVDFFLGLLIDNLVKFLNKNQIFA